MNIEVLNQNFELIAVISEYESFIWADRYNTPGDFEIYSPITSNNLVYLIRDNYIRMEGSEHLMIIEDLVYESNSNGNGRKVQILGRSLESILDRRIVWGKVDVNGNFQDEVARLFNDNIISPEVSDRAISNFIFERSADSRITSLTVNGQYTGDTLLSIIQTLTEEFDIGWKIILNDNNQFVFSFYVGTDRSYQQNDVPSVVFSPDFENVISSTYTVSGATAKTVILVSGNYRPPKDPDAQSDSEEEEEDTTVYRTIGGGTGLLRREMYANESGIEQDEGMTKEDYEAKLDQFGSIELKQNAVSKKFDGQYETRLTFKYGVDFFIGDTVEVADEFGNEATSKVVEFIWSNNISDGEEAYPTFRSNDE